MGYAIKIAKNQINGLLEKAGVKNDIETETPPANIKADFCVPFFKIAVKHKENPQVLAEKILEKINLKNTLFSKVERVGAYLNFILDWKKFNNAVISDLKLSKENYGASSVGKGKTVVIDYSSPNIAKPFSIGHLRSTVIGQALYYIYQFLGYKVIGDNHLGDWGTQFGKLIYAYKKWGNESKLKKNPMSESLRLYVKFHDMVKNNPKLDNEARDWFKKLECGDKEAVKIWEMFRKLSITDFQKIYKLLGIKFDFELGESFYKDKTEEIIKECIKKKIAKWEVALDENGKKSKENEKVLLVDLKKYDINTPLLLQKSDGTTLYATRDLAAIKYRINKWNPESILYVVGSEQKLYFKQLFKVAELIGLRSKLIHIDFGLIRLPEGKMSSREGRVIFLKDVLDEAVKRVGYIIHERGMNKEEKEKIAKIVGIGAIKYADLSQSRNKDIVFNWNKIISLKGNSGPYLQYQYVRIQSILKKACASPQRCPKGSSEVKEVMRKLSRIVNPILLNSPEEIELIKSIAKFNEVLNNILTNHETHILTDYLYELAESFSLFYEKHSILGAKNKDLKSARLYLCQCTAQILEQGLSLLGIEVPGKM